MKAMKHENYEIMGRNENYIYIIIFYILIILLIY